MGSVAFSSTSPRHDGGRTSEHPWWARVLTWRRKRYPPPCAISLLSAPPSVPVPPVPVHGEHPSPTCRRARASHWRAGGASLVCDGPLAVTTQSWATRPMYVAPIACRGHSVGSAAERGWLSGRSLDPGAADVLACGSRAARFPLSPRGRFEKLEACGAPHAEAPGATWVCTGGRGGYRGGPARSGEAARVAAADASWAAPRPP